MFRDRPFDHVGGQRNPSIPFEGLGRIFCFGGFFWAGEGGVGVTIVSIIRLCFWWIRLSKSYITVGHSRFVSVVSIVSFR